MFLKGGHPAQQLWVIDKSESTTRVLVTRRFRTWQAAILSCNAKEVRIRTDIAIRV